jgi:hypothetical protein
VSNTKECGKNCSLSDNNEKTNFGAKAKKEKKRKKK